MDLETRSPEVMLDITFEQTTQYRIIRAVIGFLLRSFARVEIAGLEHLPVEGPYLIATNHLHWLDPPGLLVAFPYRAFAFAAAKRQNHWFFGRLFRALGTIWVRRGEVDRQALRQATTVLNGGGVLGVAPEGTRSSTGALQQARNGAAYLAYRTGVKLVPAVTWGQEEVFRSLRRLRRSTMHIVFGPPFVPRVRADGAKGSAALSFGPLPKRSCTGWRACFRPGTGVCTAMWRRSIRNSCLSNLDKFL